MKRIYLMGYMALEAFIFELFEASLKNLSLYFVIIYLMQAKIGFFWARVI
jgi:hypothetical protein